MSENVANDEPYLLVEEVAERLGLPLSVLLHRVEAGDIPARRVERADGLHYALRLGDLGIELDDRGLRSSAIEHEAEEPDEETLTTVFQPIHEPIEPTIESAIVSAFNSGPEPLPAVPRGSLDVTGRRMAEEEGVADNGKAGGSASGGDDEGHDRWPRADALAPPWSVRPREPQQPPPWLTQGPAAGFETVPDADAVAEIEVPEDAAVADGIDEYVAPVSQREPEDDRMPAAAPSGVEAETEEDLADEDTVVAELAVPPPSQGPAVGLLDTAAASPRGDLASMSLDARELVAGLLDRWERTLEQRIYTEQRQRFQAELVARQNMVKQLQMELHTARAEHAAAQAEKDRVLAGKERELADRERDLAESRRLAQEAERLIAPTASRRRRWFWSRDD